MPSAMYLLMQKASFDFISLHFEQAFAASVGPPDAFMAHALHLCASPSALRAILRNSDPGFQWWQEGHSLAAGSVRSGISAFADSAPICTCRPHRSSF